MTDFLPILCRVGTVCKGIHFSFIEEGAFCTPKKEKTLCFEVVFFSVCFKSRVEKRRENDSRRIYTHHQSQWVLLLFLGWRCWRQKKLKTKAAKCWGGVVAIRVTWGSLLWCRWWIVLISLSSASPKHWTLFWQIANQVPNWIRNPNQRWDWIFPFFMFYHPQTIVLTRDSENFLFWDS